MTYKGNTIEAHRVKGKKAPKIQQVDEQVTKPSEQQRQEEELFDSLNSPHSKPQSPKFTIFTTRDKKDIYDLESVHMKEVVIEF